MGEKSTLKYKTDSFHPDHLEKLNLA